jgi:hypothetical protein
MSSSRFAMTSDAEPTTTIANAITQLSSDRHAIPDARARITPHHVTTTQMTPLLHCDIRHNRFPTVDVYATLGSLGGFVLPPGESRVGCDSRAWAPDPSYCAALGSRLSIADSLDAANRDDDSLRRRDRIRRKSRHERPRNSGYVGGQPPRGSAEPVSGTATTCDRRGLPQPPSWSLCGWGLP